MSDDSSQLAFWRGDFGNEYINRNEANPGHVQSLIRFWSDILRTTDGAPPESILEVGANIGNNLRALSWITFADLWGLEPNKQARRRLIDDGILDNNRILDGAASAIDLKDGAVDMVFTSGVLIHIHPDDLEASCREMFRVSSRYIVCVEYFSDKEQEIHYRGHDGVLFKRDFGEYWMTLFPELRVLDYGFAWKKMTGLDNLTWWLFEKKSR
ncbi:MAG: methyltransferase domain-containing protein [Magnetococcales bacterium]|nr:methyltransferase domain-containing protein [Magnetococcales bacterium]